MPLQVGQMKDQLLQSFFNCIYARIGADKVDRVKLTVKWEINMGIIGSVLRDGGRLESRP